MSSPSPHSASAPASLNVDAAVRERYSAAAQAAEASLCCPVDYDAQYLEVIPQEVIDRDYGCGDPSKYVQPGDTVLDLGSGGGKICFIAAQAAGPEGRVIGVDCNAEMLALARSAAPTVAERIGYSNIEFRKGQIQDLRLDLDRLEQQLTESPICSSADWLHAQEAAARLRVEHPLVADQSVDLVVSNCVLNLVRQESRRELFAEVYRVLRRGGRAVISDIVCDEDVPEELRNDPTLWSGCLSGAFREDKFLAAFEEAGFYGVEILERQQEPWAVIEGIEFRSLTARAFRGKDGPCLDRKQAVIYNGPWKAVIDDDGHRLNRGERMAVCEKTFDIYTKAPYGSQITPVPPQVPVPTEQAQPMRCDTHVRPAAETKNAAASLTILPGEGDACCGTDGCC